MKIAYVALLLALVLAGSARAETTNDGKGDINCYTTFYQTKDATCLDKMLVQLSLMETDKKPHQEGATPGLVGFFGEVFRAYPPEKERLLAKPVSATTKSLFIQALLAAELPGDARTYAKANGVEADLKFIKGRKPAALKRAKPQSLAAENDLLIGAYMASGNLDYAKRIMSNFTTADAVMVKDALRMALAHINYGSNLAPEGRKPALLIAACDKYECGKDEKKSGRLLTLSSAFWALSSLSQKDEALKKAFMEFFDRDYRLKKILVVETRALHKYAYDLTLSNEKKKDFKIESSLAAYESLGDNM